jgi:squalene-hopene/tetraprenyl-beta-curcumene cyclase
MEHQEDEGDFAGIQPAMFNSLLALHLLGYAKDHPACVKGMEAVDRFMLEKDGRLWMQACVSPLWDTAICANALLDSGLPSDHPALVKAGEWVISKQVIKRGDWQVKNPGAEPGGWAFEFFNELYPDTDDTAEILLFLNRVEIPDNRWKLSECERAMDWLLSMQSKAGGWGAFDVDNDKEVLNEVPFADHKALLDPPTVDVTSRILWMLAKWGFKKHHPQVQRAIAFVKDRQEVDGCWFGRWGVNYIYGTFLALNGLRAIGEDMEAPFSRKAVRWLETHQNEDGGWGETCQSYEEPSLRGRGQSTASQTAWALLGLIAADEAESPMVKRGVRYLIETQKGSGEFSGSWWENEFTGTGFPVHFFIKYHMYQHFFPLMALSRYGPACNSFYWQAKKPYLGLMSLCPLLPLPRGGSMVSQHLHGELGPGEMFGGGCNHFSAHNIGQGEVDIKVRSKIGDPACDNGLGFECLAHLTNFFFVVRVGRFQV